jgi:rod shape-determining protein MreD
MSFAPSKKISPLASVVIFISLFTLVILRYALHGIVLIDAWVPWILASGVFFWAAFYPKNISVYTVVLLGLIEDGIVGTPFGVHAVCLLTMYHLTLNQKQTLSSQPMVVCWTGFIMNTAICIALFGAIMFVVGAPLTWAILWSFIATSAAFPIIFYAMKWVESKITRNKI